MEAAKPSKILGIFGLNSSTNENDLEKEFLPFGDIISIKLIYDRFVSYYCYKQYIFLFDSLYKTNKSRGFGFIKYTTVSDATKAKGMMDGKYLHNRKIRVDYSLTKKPHSPTPGIYLGNSWIIQNNKNY
ncbi:RNA-binding domain-containing protein [Neoconidiobolus thromboides FSU 785]|nr:RNA-binding domain-containing protein [Neoconidiobolus thromboides FSU 785]